MVVEESTLLSFIEQGLEVAKAIPEYFSKYSNKRSCLIIILKKRYVFCYKMLL